MTCVYTLSNQGECYRFQANQSLLLNDPQTIWVVKSGYLALFAIALNDDIPEGTRRYLFSSTAGQAMFGTAPSLDGKQHQILAVFLEETELIKVSRAEFNQLFADANSEAVAFIEGWISQLGSVIAGITTPTTPLLPQGIQYYSLAKNQIFQSPGYVAWVQILQGRAKWMGFGDLLLTPVSGMLPLHPNMWLEANDTVELKTATTLEISDLDSLLGGLSQLQTYFLNCIELLQRQEMDAELLRFEARERLESQVMEETLAELASVLPQPKLNRLTGSSEFSNSVDATQPDRALLVAAGAVGRALGIQICPPVASEDPKRVQDPVEAIARASHIRVRRIQLRDNWWQKDCGAILAFTLQDKQPVALLPISDTRYQLYAPWQQKRISVDAGIAAALAPTGYVFYRPLPNKQLKTFDLLQFALQGHSKELIVIVVMGITISLLGMLTPQATAILIDKAIPDANRGLLSQLVVGLLAAAFGGMLFQLALGFATIRLETFADSATEAAVWDRLLNLKATFFRSFSVGDLNSRVTAISQIRQRLGNTIFKTIFSSMFSLLNLGLLFYYDGQDLAALDVHAVRRQLGVVMQNSRLMSASIFENIASGAVLTMDEAWQAAQMAGFANDVAAMPMQMHTIVSEGGSNLSGGQRQRLLIARALAFKPRILLFDEATSALDNRTQAIVSQSLEQLKVTRIAIAHRLSTIQNADRIYVLQAGKVVQQGNFVELGNQSGLFAQLMMQQLL
ncbi:ATP-binding cassette domain-containing protein [Nostoc sp. NMS4]|uniref:ATP-binding cassette domain-containing protein n=1 Tax=Nostoc sp. NMS4 TaxID=2815390 RepID=UPI0025CEC93F|nr:ATP-binding cassette domain-containing protein [Nostoc sp. NMS4]MBN3922934.1 ATP-binding cassette domain-containing protein [Nostoc sp. NMS4]